MGLVQKWSKLQILNAAYLGPNLVKSTVLLSKTLIVLNSPVDGLLDASNLLQVCGLVDSAHVDVIGERFVALHSVRVDVPPIVPQVNVS